MPNRRPKGSSLASYAEDVGTFLGQVRSRWDELSNERDRLAKQLRGVINNAQSMLTEISGGVAKGIKRGRPAGSKNRAAGRTKGRPGRLKRRKMSAAARAKISAAQKKRWAAKRAGTRKK
jgi:hypothetical protein